MKKISIILSVLLIVSSVSFAQKGKKKKNMDEMQFAQESHDYGTMENGADGTYKFSFKNTSSKPLVITNVKSSCGCTAPTWSKEPIQPGRSGSITVKYNTNLPGLFNKTVQVFSSAKNSPVRLTIKGKVLPKPGSAKKDLNAQASGKSDKKGLMVTSKNSQKTMSKKLDNVGDPINVGDRKKAISDKRMQDIKKKKK